MAKSTGMTFARGEAARTSDSVVQAICLLEDRMEQELRLALAIALYAQGLVSFAKARESLGYLDLLNLMC